MPAKIQITFLTESFNDFLKMISVIDSRSPLFLPIQ